MKLLLSPHADDECLFAAYTIQRENPLVVIVFDSHVQFERGNPVTASMRRAETQLAMKVLSNGGPPIEVRFLGLSDAAEDPNVIAELSRFHAVQYVWAPAFETGGHPQHNLVANAADILWPGAVTHYMTYTYGGGKSTGRPVPISCGRWIRRKLRALSCYESQIDIEALGCREHFTRDLVEYYG